PTAMSSATDLPKPPDVEARPYVVRAPHGAERQDEYYWLRDDDRKAPDMLACLQAENAYVDAVMAPLKPVQDKLYEEIVGRIKQDDSSVPSGERGWWYDSRFETGKDYPVFARRPAGDGVDAISIQAANEAGDFAGEQVLLDVNVMAEGKDYFNIGEFEVSQDNRLLAWAEDDVGRRQYVVRVKDLETGEVFDDVVHHVSPNLVWADDNRTLLYVETDPETLLTRWVRKHVLGTPVADDVLLYEETDDSFYMGVDRTRDDAFICIHVSSTVSDEMRCAPATDPSTFTVFAPRERDVEYSADHHGGRWVIRTNAGGASNFKLMTAPTGATTRAQWQEWIGHDAEVFIDGFELFDGFTAIGERSGGLERIRLLKADGSAEYV